jgi:hypothetical protein
MSKNRLGRIAEALFFQHLGLERRQGGASLGGFVDLAGRLEDTHERGHRDHVVGIEFERPPRGELALFEQPLFRIEPGGHHMAGREIGEPRDPVRQEAEGLPGLSGPAIRIGEWGESARVRVAVRTQDGVECPDLFFQWLEHENSGGLAEERERRDR